MTITPYPNVDRAIWTAVTLALAYGAGAVINSLVIRWLQRLSARSEGHWDDVVVRELRKRIPLWSLLAGLWVVIGYWPIEARWATFGSHLIGALAVLSVTLAASAMAVGLVGDLAPRVNPEVQISGLMRNVIRLVVISIGLLILLRGIGVEITPMLAALGVGGLAVALALQDPLANLFAGLFLTLAGRVRIGEYVKLEGGPEGFVADFAWDATKLRALPGNLIIVPNAKLAQAIVTNFDRPVRDVGLSVDLTVPLDADLVEVERIALEVARAVMKDVTGGMPDAEPLVRFQGYSDLGVRCAVLVRSLKFEDQFLVKHELVKRLHTTLRAAGITMPTLGQIDGRTRVGSQKS
jgi:small-conductance mechanosensitive channel